MKELLEKYPKAAKVVKDYYLDIFMKGLEGKNFPDEYIEHVKQQGLQAGIVESVLENNPISLITVFDKNEIYIQSNVVKWENENKDNSIEFIYTIYDQEFPGGVHKLRIDAEKEVIRNAFFALESKLNEK